ncbi:MAG TPA: hypothetical protein VFG37_06005 [Planctomycetota bacterium]|nr:hypothetical protein [Planctomycetota bacterium]
MRYAILVPIALVAALIAWRIGGQLEAGRVRRAKEVAAREVMESILRAEEERRLHPPAGANGAIYAYLSGLLSEGRLQGLSPVSDPRLEIYRAGDYCFHVSLLTRLNRPLRVPSDPGTAEPRFGARFEAWAWPAEPGDSQLVLYFASTGGTLLQGENGMSAGPGDFPGDRFSSENPLQQHERAGGRDTRWLEVFALTRS